MNTEQGEIYKITNIINNKIYIGKTKNGIARYKRHMTNAKSINKKLSTECPIFYEDIRKFGKQNFKYEVICECQIEQLKQLEEKYIKLYKSYDEMIGYNFLCGMKKPIDKIRLKKYCESKQMSNSKRAEDGKLKKKDIEIPPNIYYRKSKIKDKEIEGYFIQIKINGILYTKMFGSSKISLEKKLDLAKNFLNELKSKK